ncbi:MAG: transcription elongation factor GreA [Campylobacterota bacterium]|nr:transcription elongation factor GreA [Campylobacterota bacterium]
MQKNLISSQGYQKYIDEFKHLAHKEKPHWVKEKEIAAAHGDRSENAEYISAKEMLRNIDKRLRFLDKIINNSQVVQIDTIPHDRVNFGSKVSVVDLESDEEKTFIILGTHESNPSKNIISNKSPLGKVLLGKVIGDEVELNINGQKFEYEIEDIILYNFED